MDNFVIAALNVGGHTEAMDFEKTDQWHKLLELTYAAWRVADIAIENDFLKNKVKQTAAEILVEYPNALGDRKKMEELFSRIRSQRALLSLAQKASDLRELNFTILKNEYHKMGTVVVQLMPSAEQHHNTPKKEVSASRDTVAPAFDARTIHRHADAESVKEEASQRQQEKETEKTRGARISERPEAHRTERVEVLTEREKKIYQFFSKRKGDKIRLKEIAQVFPDLTDRTVRNDLRALCMKKLVVRSDGHGQASFYKLGSGGAEA